MKIKTTQLIQQFVVKTRTAKQHLYKMKSIYIFLSHFCTTRIPFCLNWEKLATGVCFDVTNTVTAKVTACSFVSVNTRGPREETSCENLRR